MAEPFYTRHRGPFLLHVTRPHKRKRGFHTSEWLTGPIRNGPDVEFEARALLEDTRDTIVFVAVYSETEQQFVCGYTRKDT